MRLIDRCDRGSHTQGDNNRMGVTRVSLKKFVGLVGAACLVAGLLFLLVPVELDHGMSCGSAAAPQLAAARTKDAQNELGRTLSGGKSLFDETDFAGDCRSKLSTRRAWAIPLAVVGGIVALGALVVKPSRPSETG